MSIETWKEKFFHVPADAPSLDTALKRLDHSIRMWVGFRKKSLEKHDLAKAFRWIVPKQKLASIMVDGVDGDFTPAENSALCEAYFKRVRLGEFSCKKCPLSDFTANRNCGKEFEAFVFDNDPEPMISLLLAAENEKRFQAGKELRYELRSLG
jgi:hypothetical protein